MNQKERIEARFKDRQRKAMEARERERNERSKDYQPTHPDQN